MTRFLSLVAAMLVACGAAMATARAQAAPAPESTPAPSANSSSQNLTPMQRAYDGNIHVTLTPYVWLPTLKQNVQFNVPTLPQHVGGVIQSSVQVGPNDYAAKINSAIMFAFDVRKGDMDVFGDYINTNFSSNSNFNTIITGPLGRVSVPVSFSTDSRLAASIWEVGAGFAIAHGNNADLNVFAGWRQFPVHLTLGYNAVIGRRGIIAPSGTIQVNPMVNGAIFGLRGKAFFGDNHWFVPYYIDTGVGMTSSTWEAFTGAGYMFNHGQSLTLAYRTLNYDSFPANSPVQKLGLSGVLLGYGFGL